MNDFISRIEHICFKGSETFQEHRPLMPDITPHLLEAKAVFRVHD